MHARAAGAIRNRWAQQTEAVAGLLSTHYSRAGDHESSWEFSLMAGNEARAKYANAEAAEFYTRALDAARTLGTDCRRVHRRGRGGVGRRARPDHRVRQGAPRVRDRSQTPRRSNPCAAPRYCARKAGSSSVKVATPKRCAPIRRALKAIESTTDERARSDSRRGLRRVRFRAVPAGQARRRRVVGPEGNQRSRGGR